MILFCLELVGGLVYLLLGGDLLVRGALALAKRASAPPMLVGLTVVAFGTSAPELVVSVTAVLSGHGTIAIGNVVGSNVANVLAVLGAPALIYPMACAQPTGRRHGAIMLGATGVFVALCFAGPLTLPHGGLLLILLAAFLLAAQRESAGPTIEAAEELQRVLGLPQGGGRIALFIALGIVTLPLGSKLVVSGSVGIATELNIPEAAIALSIVAFGTSLPELSTTMVAAFYRSADVAVGNVIGSNIMNLLGIMGVTSLLAAVPVPARLLHFDLWVMTATTLLLAVYLWGRRSVGRRSGAAFLLAYSGYVYSIFATRL